VLQNNSRNTQDRLEFESLNNLVQELCRGLVNTAFGNKVRTLEPGHGLFGNFTIYNSCLKLCYFPKEWNQGKDLSNLSNYCPISLLNTFVSTQNVLPNHQFGFRSVHSTSHQVNRVVRHVKNRKFRGQSTGMLLLDMEKAFDDA
jgi:hypothetical protein